MTDRPILFSAPMVQALLAGRKTQTRRLLKLRGHRTFTEFGPSDTQGYDWHFRDAGMRWHDLKDDEVRARLPYQPGDRLWVREAFARTSVAPIVATLDKPWVVYQVGDNRTDYGGPWKPSIHLPRADSRLTLTVTDVRVQRVTDITEADAQAEGAQCIKNPAFDLPGDRPEFRRGFCEIWERLHGFNSWLRGDWVTALTFTVEQRNIDAP